ncbi:MAG: hypothetical protein EBY38_06680 [Flavobacteriaceae bacterium]|nr:hypothetical protein [Flavobacteriaceae bacterium]
MIFSINRLKMNWMAVILTVAVLFNATLGLSTILCIESDGTHAIEFVASGSCALSDNHTSEKQVFDEAAIYDGNNCYDCTDIVLSADEVNQTIQTSALPEFTVATTEPVTDVDVHVGDQISFISDYPNQVIQQRQTIVLLI